MCLRHTDTLAIVRPHQSQAFLLSPQKNSVVTPQSLYTSIVPGVRNGMSSADTAPQWERLSRNVPAAPMPLLVPTFHSRQSFSSWWQSPLESLSLTLSLNWVDYTGSFRAQHMIQVWPAESCALWLLWLVSCGNKATNQTRSDSIWKGLWRGNVFIGLCTDSGIYKLGGPRQRLFPIWRKYHWKPKLTRRKETWNSSHTYYNWCQKPLWTFQSVYPFWRTPEWYSSCFQPKTLDG